MFYLNTLQKDIKFYRSDSPWSLSKAGAAGQSKQPAHMRAAKVQVPFMGPE